MYFTLKKLTPLMLFINDFFIGKKKISLTTILSIFLIVGGSLLVAKDSFTKDYLGYCVVLLSNILTIIYCKLTEIYHKITGYTNIQLLIYNNYLTLPSLFLGIFITGEYRRLYDYFDSEDNDSEGSVYSLLFYLFLYGVICSVLTSSFFISNEKNTSLFTQLLSDTKYIVITLISYSVLKSFTFTWKNVTGLCLSTLAAIIITIKSLYDNIQIKNLNNETSPRKKSLKEDSQEVQIDSSKNMINITSSN
jgi:drug/metabolite transporter (DMT)-like permease